MGIFPVIFSTFPENISTFPVIVSTFSVKFPIFPVIVSMFSVNYSMFPVNFSTFPVIAAGFLVIISAPARIVARLGPLKVPLDPSKPSDGGRKTLLIPKNPRKFRSRPAAPLPQSAAHQSTTSSREACARSRRPRGAPPKTKAGQSPRRPGKTLKLVRNRSFGESGLAAPPIPESYQKASTPATKIGPRRLRRDLPRGSLGTSFQTENILGNREAIIPFTSLLQ